MGIKGETNLEKKILDTFRLEMRRTKISCQKNSSCFVYAPYLCHLGIFFINICYHSENVLIASV